MLDQPSRESAKAKSSVAWWICGLLVLSLVGVYWPVGGYSFILYDDPKYVFRNPYISNGLNWSGVAWAFTAFYAANWHPLTWLSHMLDVQLFGMNAGWHHITNVVLHAANTVLLFLWLRRLTGFLWRSAMVAALFGLHPLHVESVAWISERKDVLSTFFLFLSLMAYTRYAEVKIQNPESRIQNLANSGIKFIRLSQSSTFYLLSLGCFAFGLMSKPMLVTLPFVLLLLDYWPLRRISDFRFSISDLNRLLLEKIPFFILSAASCVVTYLAQQSGKAVMSITILPLADRIENSFIAYVGYLGKMLWPENLAVLYPLYSPIDTDKAIVGASILLLISAGAYGLRRRQPWLITGWIWFLGTMMPVIGLVQVGSQSMADRYTYVPLIGIFIAIVWLLAEFKPAWSHRRWAYPVISLMVLALCWKLSAVQVRYWQNSETLARHALAVTTANAPMQGVLGNVLREQGKIEEARQHFAEALRICPDSVSAHCDMALALTVEGRLDEAADICRSALKIQPEDVKINYILGNIFSSLGKLPEAAHQYEKVLQIDPDHSLALNDMAWLLATAPEAELRDGARAVRLAEHNCELSNYRVTLYVGTLAAAYAEAGRFDDAVKTAEKAVALAASGKNQALIDKNRELLELYQQKKPYHEPALIRRN